MAVYRVNKCTWIRGNCGSEEASQGQANEAMGSVAYDGKKAMQLCSHLPQTVTSRGMGMAIVPAL